MKFTINSKELEEALVSVQLKGKGVAGAGFGNTNLGNHAMLYLSNGTLSIWNGNTTVAVKVELPVEEGEDGEVCVDSSRLTPYLKAFKDDVTVNVGDFIQMTSGTKKASAPLVMNHPNADAISRMRGMISHITYQVQPNLLFRFGKSAFEGMVSLTLDQLKSAIKNCELVHTGIYKFNYHEQVLSISSRNGTTNKYEEAVTPVFQLGESATVEFSGPLYAIFKKDQMINIYMKDDFPILMVANDRLVLKAPQVNG